MKHQLKYIAAATVAALGASQALALEVYNGNGWKLDISGSVNAFYTSTKADNKGSSVSIENGLLPGYLNVTASTQQRGWDIKGVIGYWPGINTNGAGVAGVGKTTADVRTNYLSFGRSDVGTFKAGRDIALYQSNSILNDMTLIGVGGGASSARNINTTLGGIGAGYIYAEFQPQITYTTPDMNGFHLSVGVFDNKDTSSTNATNGTGSNPGYQALAEYAFKGTASGKLWFGLENQKFSDTVTPRTDSATGYEVGAVANFGNFGLLASTYWGDGIGNVVQYAGGVDAAGNQRKSDGYLLQATYKIDQLKLGISYGQSRLKNTAQEGGGDNAKTQGTTLGAYYSLTPSVTLVGELNQRNDKVASVKTDTISLGAILFF